MKNIVINVCMVVSVVAISVLFLEGCSKANEKDLQSGNNTGCDTVNMAYQADIQPILAKNCYSCHGDGASSQAGIDLKDYGHVKAQADNGNLIGVITHAPGYPAMPFNLPKLSDCDINKIRDWINKGAQNN